MPIDSQQARTEAATVFLAWGLPSVEVPDGSFDEMAMWLTGGVTLVLWTGLALLLTA